MMESRFQARLSDPQIRLNYYAMPQLHTRRESLLAANLRKACSVLITDSSLTRVQPRESSRLIVKLTSASKGNEDENEGCKKRLVF